MKVLLIGSGNTLYFLCRRFSEKGYEVVVINQDHTECIQLARQFTVRVINGDGSDPEILKDAGAMSADVLLAITPNDHDNLVICQLASLIFQVPRAIALTNDPDNADIFKDLGVTAFSTTHIIGTLIEQRASLEQILDLLPVGEGRVNVTEMILDPVSPVAGKYLRDIVLPENALVAVVIRNNLPIVPRGANQLMAGDRLVLITLPENHESVLEVFTGEKNRG